MSTKKTPALRSAWALMLVVPLAALVPPGRPPRTTKLDAATLARRRERREALKPLLTWPEEQRLGRECRRLAALEDVRAREGARLRRAPTRGEWAAAANYSSEAALRADRARMRACRDELIARNLRLVLSVAGRYKPQPGLEFDDLVAEGNFGLAKAAARFDPGRGFRFSTYAVWWIRQAISHAVGHDARAIRLPAHVHDKLRPVWKSPVRRVHPTTLHYVIPRRDAAAPFASREEYREAHGRDPDDRHVAAALGIDHTKVRALGRAAREVASLDASALLRGGPRKGSGAASARAARGGPARRRDAGARAARGRGARARRAGPGARRGPRGPRARRRRGALRAGRAAAQEPGADRRGLRPDARAHPADRARRALQAAHAAPRAQAGAARRPARGAAARARPRRRGRRPRSRAAPAAIAIGDRLVAADDAGRACVVRQIKKGGWLVVSWEDEPGRRAFARPSAFRLPDRKAAPGGESAKSIALGVLVAVVLYYRCSSGSFVRLRRYRCASSLS